MAAERLHRKSKDIVDAATKSLNNHLRMRKALRLDDEPIKTFDDNPIFQKKLMPKGDILNSCDSHNRLLWYIEYATITVESIAHSIQSSQACKYQFWQFEYMLRTVMAQEEKTGRLSSLRHIIDMNGYEINPFTMLFVSSGTLAYYSQLFHYENYPELLILILEIKVTPVDIVNIAKWIHVPYKLAKAMMPAGFSDKFRLHDNHFLKTLTEDIQIENIPNTLGGKNKEIKCIGAEKVSLNEYWKPDDQELLNNLEVFHVQARKYKYYSIEIFEPKKLSWYFRTDGDIFFGVFFESSDLINNDKEFDIDSLEMVYPWLKLSAKIVHERDSIICDRNGKYHVVFCNKHSWLSRRTVDSCVHITDSDGNIKRLHSDGTLSISNLKV
uniref:CRAL-TRIO domain-containing protein n=1 Tax=Heterorhabditis bacteriophora TaxID=37862 RepID=A0A1I7XGB9_HETBA